MVDDVRGNRDRIPDTMPKADRYDAWISAACARSNANWAAMARSAAATGDTEAQWIEHCRQVGNHSYLTSPPAHFRVC